jgi:hypothetical protein
MVTLKVNYNGLTRRFKLPLRDMGAGTLEDKVRLIHPHIVACILPTTSTHGALSQELDTLYTTHFLFSGLTEHICVFLPRYYPTTRADSNPVRSERFWQSPQSPSAQSNGTPIQRPPMSSLTPLIYQYTSSSIEQPRLSKSSSFELLGTTSRKRRRHRSPFLLKTSQSHLCPRL